MKWLRDFLKQTGDFMSDAIKLRLKKLQIINLHFENWPYKNHIYMHLRKQKNHFLKSHWKHS